jgi:hypothetical protein
MDDVARFREKAEECRRHAQLMSLNDHRDMFLKLAREWDALADSLEKRMRENVEPGRSAKDSSSET